MDLVIPAMAWWYRLRRFWSAFQREWSAPAPAAPFALVSKHNFFVPPPPAPAAPAARAQTLYTSTGMRIENAEIVSTSPAAPAKVKTVSDLVTLLNAVKAAAASTYWQDIAPAVSTAIATAAAHPAGVTSVGVTLLGQLTTDGLLLEEGEIEAVAQWTIGEVNTLAAKAKAVSAASAAAAAATTAMAPAPVATATTPAAA